MNEQAFRLTAYFTAPTFPAQAVLFEEADGARVRYFWELRDGSKLPCSPEFVKARRHAWTRRPV